MPDDVATVLAAEDRRYQALTHPDMRTHASMLHDRQLADVILRSGAGAVVDPGDVDGLREVLVPWPATVPHSAEQPPRRPTWAGLLPGTSTWDVATRPLADFCAAPRRAPRSRAVAHRARPTGSPRPAREAGQPLRRLQVAMADVGPALVGRRLTARMERVLHRP